MTKAILLSLIAIAAGIHARSSFGAVSVPTQFVNEFIVGGLNEPTGLAFLPDGRLLLVEQRTGRVRMIVNGHLASTDPVFTVPSLNADGGERGLQGLAVDPGWPQRPYLYFHYTRTGSRTRLVRYTATGDVSNPTGENLGLTSALLLIDDIPDADPNHNGGTVRFGPDGHLYVSLGEDAVRCAAQDSTGLRGQLLRLDVSRLPSGGGGPVPRALIIPSTSPLSTPDSNARLVYAYGLRNPWRFHIDPVTGNIYLGDVGEDSFEEVDEVFPGDNLGWPFREGFLTRTPSSCTEPGGSGQAGYDRPIWVVPHGPNPTAILTAEVYRHLPAGSSNWPLEYLGDVFFSNYVDGYIRRLRKTGGVWGLAPRVPGQTTDDWATGLASPVDFLVGPDGSLWWLSHDGSVQRIRYTGPTVKVADAGPSALSLRGAPNPFVARTELSFGLGAPAAVRLLIYDARGSRVRTLLEGEAPAGETRISWDGMNDRGSAVAPGIYFVRFERPGSVETLRVLRLK